MVKHTLDTYTSHITFPSKFNQNNHVSFLIFLFLVISLEKHLAPLSFFCAPGTCRLSNCCLNLWRQKKKSCAWKALKWAEKQSVKTFGYSWGEPQRCGCAESDTFNHLHLALKAALSTTCPKNTSKTSDELLYKNMLCKTNPSVPCSPDCTEIGLPAYSRLVSLAWPPWGVICWLSRPYCNGRWVEM